MSKDKIQYSFLLEDIAPTYQQCLIVDILYQINVLIKTSWTNFQTTLNIKTLNRIKIKIHYDTSLVRKIAIFYLSICFAYIY